MPKLPIVAIVGRPNVGKSSLFNFIARRRIAIVEPTAGVTRDRISTHLEDDGMPYELMDTGGIGIEDHDNLTADVERQIQIAINEASMVLFVVDARRGLAALDEEVARRLRGLDKPIICVVNKCDTPKMEEDVAEFYRLGWHKLICVSAQQRRGREELMEEIRANLPRDGATEPAEVALKLAIVGRRNTGKSTFINCLAESERMIVSEVAGTTRDSVDVHFERDGLHFIAIDTAGVRKKKSLASDIEFYSLTRAQRSIRRADVVLFFLEAAKRVSQVDKKLAEYVFELQKPAIFVLNKWDLVKDKMASGEMAEYLGKVFPSLDYVPIATVTAKDGRNVHAVLNLAQSLHKQASARVSTGDLNRVLRKALLDSDPPMRQNRRPKVNYATQVAANPPTIVMFTNGPELFDEPYLRYLLGVMRDNLPFREIPIRLELRLKKRQDPGTWEAETPVRPKSAKRKKAAASPNEDVLWRDL